MNTVVLPVSATFRVLPFSTAPLRRVGAWWAQGAERRRMRAELRKLSALDQHDLNDLGVGRSELDYWAQTPDANASTKPTDRS